jgi:hypothetical protein
LLSAAAPTVRNSVSSRPQPPHLRTLYFPWVKTSSAHQKHVLVDRRWLCQVHKQHLNLAFEGGATGKVSMRPDGFEVSPNPAVGRRPQGSEQRSGSFRYSR